jgi:hypothetical protein
MGFKKAIKKAVKQVTGGVKKFVSDPLSKEGLEAGAGIALAPATGGASLAATADAGRRVQNQMESEERAAQQQADLVAENTRQYGWGSMAEVVEARRKKQKQLEERGEGQATGLASLIGKGKTLG